MARVAKFRCCRPLWLAANDLAVRGDGNRQRRHCTICQAATGEDVIDDEIHVLSGCVANGGLEDSVPMMPAEYREAHPELSDVECIARWRGDPRTVNWMRRLHTLIDTAHASRILWGYMVAEQQPHPGVVLPLGRVQQLARQAERETRTRVGNLRTPHLALLRDICAYAMPAQPADE